MWQLYEPKPVKLLIGILAADEACLESALAAVSEKFGPLDFQSDIWPFTLTDYYREETGENILRCFVTKADLMDPGDLADIKLTTNEMERALAARHATPEIARPVNLDPGIIEPAKLILASTKDFTQRIYIGKNVYAELTLSYKKGDWLDFFYTYPDYKLPEYQKFFSKVRDHMVGQLRKLKRAQGP